MADHAQDLKSAKRKLADNRASGKDARKNRLNERDISAVMAENKRRGGSDVGEKPQRKSGLTAQAQRNKIDKALREAQNTDSNNQ